MSPPASCYGGRVIQGYSVPRRPGARAAGAGLPPFLAAAHLARRLATSKTFWCPGGWLPPGFVAVVTMKSVGPGTFTLNVAVAMVGAIRSSNFSMQKRPFLTL